MAARRGRGVLGVDVAAADERRDAQDSHGDRHQHEGRIVLAEATPAQHGDASWTEDQCAGIEIVDGMALVGPSASKRHNRLARIVANALDTASGPDWNADIDFDVRLQDVPLNNHRPDVTVYRADTIDVIPTRPEHVLLVAEVVSPGSETTDRIVKADQYAKAGIAFYWRIEQAATGVP